MNATRNPVVAAVADASDEMMALDQASPNPAPVTTTAEDAQEVAADLRKLIDSAPAHIWLDLGESLEALTDEGTFRDLREVSWSEDNATGVGIKYVRAPVAVATSDAERSALIDLIEERLVSVYHCTRVWEGWQVGTMTEDDFVEARGTDLAPDIADAVLARRKTQSPALPIDFKQATDQGGWQLVPKEPTEEMKQAGWEEHEGSVEGVYLAMLAAAPTLLGVADGDAVGGKSGGAK